MTRRQFALSAGAADLVGIPNFCSHEHWGSIDSIGVVPEGFRADVERGATPRRRTGILDLLLEPYLADLLSAAGEKIDTEELRKRFAWEALAKLRPALQPQEFSGTFQRTRRGLLDLYGVDLWDLSRGACAQLDDAMIIAKQRIT